MKSLVGFRALRALSVLAAVCIWAGAATPAKAVPILQLYIEGGTYDQATETWVASPSGSSGGAPFRLWAIGNVTGQGGKGTIHDVRLAAVYDAAVGPVQITLTPTLAGGVGLYNGFQDLSAAVSTGGWIKTVTDGSTPKLGDGSDLPNHGEYGADRVWQEFDLGDFTQSDSQTADFTNGFPTPGGFGSQINVYDISVSNFNPAAHPFTIHFDLYNHVYTKTKARYVFSPFSHDADVNATIVPEPGSFALIALGCVGFAGFGWRRRTAAIGV